MKRRYTLKLILCFLFPFLSAACVSYTPPPLNPQQTARAFEARRLRRQIQTALLPAFAVTEHTPHLEDGQNIVLGEGFRSKQL